MGFQSTSQFHNGLFMQNTNCIPSVSSRTIDPRRHPLGTASTDCKVDDPFRQLSQGILQRGCRDKHDSQFAASMEYVTHDFSSGTTGVSDVSMVSPSSTPNLHTTTLGQNMEYTPTECSFNSISGTSSYSSGHLTPLTPPDSVSGVSSSCPSRRESLRTTSKDNLYLIGSNQSPCPSYRQVDQPSFSKPLLSTFQAQELGDGNTIVCSLCHQQVIGANLQLHIEAGCQKQVEACFPTPQTQDLCQNTCYSFDIANISKDPSWQKHCLQVPIKEASSFDLHDDLGSFSLLQPASTGSSLEQGSSPYPAYSESGAPAYLSQNHVPSAEALYSFSDCSDEDNKQPVLEDSLTSSISSAENDSICMDLRNNFHRVKPMSTKGSKASKGGRVQKSTNHQFSDHQLAIAASHPGKPAPGKEQRPYKCNFPNCHSNFSRPEHLARHKRRHEDERVLLPCLASTLGCDTMIVDRGDNLQSHIRNTHFKPTSSTHNNKRFSMKEVQEDWTQVDDTEKQRVYFKMKGWDRKEVQKEFRKLDTRWNLLMERDPNKSSLTVEVSINKTRKKARHWTLIGYDILEARCLKLLDLCPEYKDRFENFDNLTLWDVDPRRLLLYNKELSVDDCKYLGVSMRITKELGLEYYDTRWVEIQKLTQAEASKEGVEEEWRRQGGPAWNRAHPQDTTKKEAKKRKAPSEFARNAQKSLEQYEENVLDTIDEEASKADRVYRSTDRTKAVKKRNEPLAIARRVITRLAGDHENRQERDNESMIDNYGGYSIGAQWVDHEHRDRR